MCFQLPQTPDEWRIIADEFTTKWNFPHCVGAMDGKHVTIVKPGKSGSTFLNYKHTFSIVLMAVVDANYKFRYVNIGAQGRIGDAGVFNSCSLSKALERNDLHFPDAEPLPGSDLIVPYMLLADDAFPLKTYIMKPYSRRGMKHTERIFNYRLSRARRVVENAFGILSSKFRVLRAPIALKTASVRCVVLAAICLHNFLRDRQVAVRSMDDSVDMEDLQSGQLHEGRWRLNHRQDGLRNLKPQSGRVAVDAKQLREQLANYFINEGSVDWQWRFI